LGWNPGSEKELFTLEELAEVFTLERVGKSGAKFDPDKAKWYNQQYLRQKDSAELATLLSAHIKANNLKESKFNLAAICGIMKERATFIKDIYEDGNYFFEGIKEYDSQTIQKKWKDNTTEILQNWLLELKNISDFKTTVIEETFKTFITKNE